MAEYLILIYGDEKALDAGGQAQGAEMMQEHMAFGEKHGPSIKGGNALQRSDTATSLRFHGDRAEVTDAPFLETKEVLGGYYLVEANDLDEAISIAKDVPAPHGGLEVRPVRVFD